MPEDRRQLLLAFEQGRPPPPRLAAMALIGMDSILGEWRDDLQHYVAKGGSLVRIVSAPVGSGKTHLGLALKATAAKLGFLLCQVDVQAQGTGDDDLALYQAFCSGLRTPASFLGDQSCNLGLRGVIDDVVARCDRQTVRANLQAARLPIPLIRDVLGDLVEAVRDGGGVGNAAMQASLALLSGAKPAERLSALRARFPRELQHFTKRPGSRDARLWQESMMIALRGLGYPGVVLVVDEHDQNSRAKLDASVVQLRRQLDRLAEGHLPGSFVLYLTLDDFAERLQDHEAVRQRLEPILGRETPSRLLVRLDSVRDRHGHEFLAHAGEKLYGLLTGEAMPSTFSPQLSALAKRHDRLGGCSTRDFVKELAQAIDV